MKRLLTLAAVIYTSAVLGQFNSTQRERLSIPVSDNIPVIRELHNNTSIATRQRWGARADSFFRENPVHRTSSGHILLEWPLQVTTGYDFQPSYFAKWNFVDQNQIDTNINTDYTCENRTYSGHDGSDISLWPFWWRMMDSNYVMAVAAAPGKIIERVDTIYDRRCFGDNFLGSNRIILQHEDGSVTRYQHLKRFGLTAKDTGQFVQKGEFLGYVASSGKSSNPHLHFEVHDSIGNTVEPFFVSSSCNSFATESWWINQPPYWDAKMNRVMTHSQVPDVGFCENDETVHAKNNFNPGEQLYIGIAFSEFYNHTLAKDSVFKPDGSLFSSQAINLQPHPNYGYNATYYTLNYTLPSANTGTWKIKVDYNGVSYYHFFSVGCVPNIVRSGTLDGSNGHIAGTTISSTAVHNTSPGDKVLYQAGTSIEFKPGFHAPAGIHLKARLKDCNYSE